MGICDTIHTYVRTYIHERIMGNTDGRFRWGSFMDAHGGEWRSDDKYDLAIVF